MRRFSLPTLCAVCVLALGLVSLPGWQTHLTLLTSFHPGFPQIKPLAVVMLLFLAGALACALGTRLPRHGPWRWARSLLAGVTGVLHQADCARAQAAAALCQSEERFAAIVHSADEIDCRH
jgi:hypothetical protein